MEGKTFKGELAYIFLEGGGWGGGEKLNFLRDSGSKGKLLLGSQ